MQALRAYLLVVHGGHSAFVRSLLAIELGQQVRQARLRLTQALFVRPDFHAVAL